VTFHPVRSRRLAVVVSGGDATGMHPKRRARQIPRVRELLRAAAGCAIDAREVRVGSPGRQPVLKEKVQRWLAQSAEVIAFVQGSGPQGGAGALIVLLSGSGPR